MSLNNTIEKYIYKIVLKLKKYNRFITMIIGRNHMILLIIQLQCYYISNLKQYKTSDSLSFVFQNSNFLSLYWKQN